MEQTKRRSKKDKIENDVYFKMSKNTQQVNYQLDTDTITPQSNNYMVDEKPTNLNKRKKKEVMEPEIPQKEKENTHAHDPTV